MTNAWRHSTLGEVCRIQIGRTPPRKEARYWTQDLERPFCTIADMTERRIDPSREGVTEAAEAEGKAKRVPAGSLLMSFKLTIGRVGFAARDLFPNEAIAWLRSADAGLDEDFLALWLEAQDLSQGSGRAVKGSTLNSDSLRAIPVMVPPLEVQRRIVDVVGALDAHIANLQTGAEATAVVLMRTRHGLFATVADGATSTISESCSFAGGYAFPPRYQGRDAGEVPFLKVSDMNTLGSERVITSAANYVSGTELKEMRGKAHPKGTTVFPKVGAALLTEKRRLLGVPAAFDNNVMGLVPGPRLDPRYLFEFMRTVRLGELAQHGAVPSVNQSHVGGLVIPLPDLAVQSEIADSLEAVQAHLMALRREASALATLRAQLLDALLSREVAIPESYDDMLAGVA